MYLDVHMSNKYANVVGGNAYMKVCTVRVMLLITRTKGTIHNT